MSKILYFAGEEFRCIDKMPASVMLDFAGASTESTGMMWRGIIDTLLEADEPERFWALVYRKNDPPEWEEFEAAMARLIQEYTDRPTERPSRSPSGVESTGGESRAASSPRVVNLSPKGGTQAAS